MTFWIYGSSLNWQRCVISTNVLSHDRREKDFLSGFAAQLDKQGGDEELINDMCVWFVQESFPELELWAMTLKSLS